MRDDTGTLVALAGYFALMSLFAIGSTIRAGARLGALFPPIVWRRVSVPFTRALQRGGGPRPELSPDVRGRLVDSFADDVLRLEELTGWSLDDWTSDWDRGAYLTRRVMV